MSRDGGRWLAGSLVAGGALVMAGALVPWLTLYAGLYGYRGTTGLYGWLVFGAGALACAIGLGAHRFGPPWLGWASAALGGGLLVFTAWLLVGLVTILRRPSAAMLAPRPGPGLFFVLAGAALILLAPVGRDAAAIIARFAPNALSRRSTTVKPAVLEGVPHEQSPG